MSVVYLGPRENRTYQFVASRENPIHQTTDALDLDMLQEWQPALIVSHGYRHIVSRDIIDAYSPAIINLHISLLPWNRGADPTLWSILEDTPAGVTIHVMDAGVDTGPILCSETVCFSAEETFRSGYERLQQTICDLLETRWDDLRAGRIEARAQEGPGSGHRLRDRERYEMLLQPLGWDTPMSLLRGRALD